MLDNVLYNLLIGDKSANMQKSDGEALAIIKEDQMQDPIQTIRTIMLAECENIPILEDDGFRLTVRESDTRKWKFDASGEHVRLWFNDTGSCEHIDTRINCDVHLPNDPIMLRKRLRALICLRRIHEKALEQINDNDHTTLLISEYGESRAQFAFHPSWIWNDSDMVPIALQQANLPVFSRYMRESTHDRTIVWESAPECEPHDQAVVRLTWEGDNSQPLRYQLERYILIHGFDGVVLIVKAAENGRQKTWKDPLDWWTKHIQYQMIDRLQPLEDVMEFVSKGEIRHSLNG